jgi:hypothetical protein
LYELAAALSALLKCADVFDAMAAGSWGDALEAADASGLVPKEPSAVEWARLFDPAVPAVRAVYPAVLHAVATAAAEAAGSLSAAAPRQRAAALQQLKLRVRALREGWTSLMAAHLPPSVHQLLREQEDRIVVPAAVA